MVKKEKINDVDKVKRLCLLNYKEFKKTISDEELEEQLNIRKYLSKKYKKD